MNGFLGKQRNRTHRFLLNCFKLRVLYIFLSCLTLQDSVILNLQKIHPVMLQYWFSILLFMLAHTISKNSQRHQTKTRALLQGRCIAARNKKRFSCVQIFHGSRFCLPLLTHAFIPATGGENRREWWENMLLSSHLAWFPASAMKKCQLFYVHVNIKIDFKLWMRFQVTKHTQNTISEKEIESL